MLVHRLPIIALFRLSYALLASYDVLRAPYLRFLLRLALTRIRFFRRVCDIGEQRAIVHTVRGSLLLLLTWLASVVLGLMLLQSHAILLLRLLALAVLCSRVWLYVVRRVLFADSLALPLKVFVDHHQLGLVSKVGEELDSLGHCNQH